MIHNFWLFVAAELVFSATPGPAVMLVSVSGLRGGVPAALEANMGIQTGNAIYIVISALGLGTVIAMSSLAFAIIKWLGVGYLIFLGLRAFFQAHEKEKPVPHGRPFMHAVVTQLSNPKAILYFSAFLPQFLNRDAPLWPQYALMFTVIAAGETLILGFYGWLGAKGRRFTTLARWRERISGTILIAIGIIFAATERS